MDDAFRTEMAAGYTFNEPVIVLGSPIMGDEVLPDVRVQMPLSRVNRHGLIAGATGTGKTKTLQLLAGQLSAAGVPVFAVDVKGDLSGVGAPGDPANPNVVGRCESLQLDLRGRRAIPSRSCRSRAVTGAHVRASVSSFGPLLLGKVLDLNDTQTSILSLVFRYCDDEDLPLLDLADLRTTLKFLGSDEGKPILEDLGGISPAVARRDPALDRDPRAGGRRRLLRRARVRRGRPAPHHARRQGHRHPARGRGRHGPAAPVLHVRAVDARPAVRELPEVGDLPKPKLAFFFDEAHLLFKDASEALMDQIERTARLIRSKGVGVYFVTQAPTDVPSSVLSQLGNRIQHALRAFTPDDADALRKTARTFPMTDHYDVERTITSLGIGEAFVTVPRPRACRRRSRPRASCPPDSRMAPAHRRGDRRGRRGVAARDPLRRGGGPRERPRDHHGAPDERPGRRRDRRGRGAAA